MFFLNHDFFCKSSNIAAVWHAHLISHWTAVTSCSFLRSSLATKCTVLVTHLNACAPCTVLLECWLLWAFRSKIFQNASKTLVYLGILTPGIQNAILHITIITSKEGSIGSWLSCELTWMTWSVDVRGQMDALNPAWKTLLWSPLGRLLPGCQSPQRPERFRSRASTASAGLCATAPIKDGPKVRSAKFLSSLP